MYLAETNLPLSKKKLISNNAGVSLETMQAGICIFIYCAHRTVVQVEPKTRRLLINQRV